MNRSENLPVVAGPVADAAEPEPGRTRLRPRSTLAFLAQLFGQDGRRRGLKAGVPVLEEARAAYLDVEWSGPADRRLPVGLIARRRV